MHWATYVDIPVKWAVPNLANLFHAVVLNGVVEGNSSGYRNPELSSPMTSKQTALVCWGPKGFNEIKIGLIQRQLSR